MKGMVREKNVPCQSWWCGLDECSVMFGTYRPAVLMEMVNSMVRIRMKSMGRLHRPFYRICVMDAKSPRDGRVIEELGHYDPLVRDAEAREVLNKERAAYWLSCGAQPSEKVAVILKRHGVTNPAAKKV